MLAVIRSASHCPNRANLVLPVIMGDNVYLNVRASLPQRVYLLEASFHVMGIDSGSLTLFAQFNLNPDCVHLLSLPYDFAIWQTGIRCINRYAFSIANVRIEFHNVASFIPHATA